MKKRINPNDLSESEIQKLLISAQRKSRSRRIKKYNKTKVISKHNNVNKLAIRINIQPDNYLDPLSTKGNRLNSLIKKVFGFTEITLVVAIGITALLGMFRLNQLNTITIQSFSLPTISPTPLITAIVLPSGHTPPTSPGGARPNTAEIPAHLRVIAQTYENIPIPTAAPEQAVRIQIPDIDIDAPILQGDGWDQLKNGVGQHIGTGLPGEVGNMVFSAHNDIFGELFRHLDKLSPGDEFSVYSNTKLYKYRVREILIVKPTEVWVMEPSDTATATLISCYPYLVNSERIVVRADLIDG